MKRLALTVAAFAVLAAGPPGVSAEVARGEDPEADCRIYCGEMAARRCDDVTSTWCNAYIIGCLAGCGVSMLG